MIGRLKTYIKGRMGLRTGPAKDLAYQELLENKKLNQEISWGLIFNNAIADSVWLKNKAVNPGRWAAGYPFLYLLYRIYNEVKPRSILEFGLGESTKLAYQYHLHNPATELTVVEHDPDWLHFFSKANVDASQFTILTDIKKKMVNDCEVNVYADLLEKISHKKYDLLVIDGPFGSEFYSRYQVVEIVEEGLLSDDFILILDDYNRKGEKQTAEQLRRLLSTKGIKFAEGVYSGEKDTWIICASKLAFLTGL